MLLRKLLIIPLFVIILFSGSILHSANATFLIPVEIIDSTGDGSGNTLNSPGNVATDLSGNVFVVGQASDNVFKITPGGTITEIIDSTGDGSGNVLSNAAHVATDSSGNVFVTGDGSDNAFKIATPGTCSTGGTPCTITEIIDSTGDGSGNSLVEALGVATDLSGNVFVVGQVSNNVFKIDTPGTCSTGGTPCTITEIIDSTGDGIGNPFNGPVDIATDLSGNVFVTGAGTSENAFKIATPGTCSTGGTPCTITEIIDTTGDGSGNGLVDPNGVATDSSGNVFVTGAGSTNAFKIATPGTCSTGGTPCTITEIIDSTGDGIGNTLVAALGVATDSSGNVFVTALQTGNAFKINTPGTCSTGGTPCTITEIIDTTGDGSGNMLQFPFGIATDSSGNVFVAGFSSFNAFKIELDTGEIPEPPSPVVGGEIIPIDSTALVLAGLQTSAIWMLPVLAGVAGTGFYLVKFRTNKE